MAKKTSKPPGAYREAKAKYPEVLEAYEAFGAALSKAGPLNEREQRLVKLGLAFGARMEGAAHSAVRKARDAGVTPDEIRHAALLAMNTMGFANGMAFLHWANDVLNDE